MLDKLDAALQFGTEALNLRAQRQEITASNIANADTPAIRPEISISPASLTARWRKGVRRVQACRWR